jgi:hypothetical protein
MPSISAATMSSCAASWGLMVDALEAIGHSADHAGRAVTVAPGIHDDRTRVLHEPFSMAQAIVDLKNEARRSLRKIRQPSQLPQKPSGGQTWLRLLQLDREMVGSARFEICRAVVIPAKISTKQKTPVIAEKIKRLSIADALTKLNAGKRHYGVAPPCCQSPIFSPAAD